MRLSVLTKAWLLCGFFVVQVQADMMDVDQLKPWEVCGLCHGITGNSAVDRFPHLAGQNSDYLVKQMLDFKSGKRSNDGGQMQNQVADIDVPEAKLIADYFSQQKIQASESNQIFGPKFRAGEAIFTKGKNKVAPCQFCHDKKTEGERQPIVNALGAPSLKLQRMGYLVKQLQDFKTGERDSDTMRAIALKLTGEDIDVLARYLSAARP